MSEDAHDSAVSPSLLAELGRIRNALVDLVDHLALADLPDLVDEVRDMLDGLDDVIASL